MPCVEDIAWKFVIRLGSQKWRCPYCHKESSGSVTRVRSHFLKQPKGGITSCTEVPEHIRTLMELLHNHEVRNKDDIAWKFVNRVEDNKWQCRFCSVEFSGDLTGVKGHLLKVPIEGINICTEVPDHIRKLMRLLLDEVAEEDSREANGQSSMEPQAHDMPTQAEVSREANGQFSMESQTRDMPIPEVAEEESREVNRQFSVEPEFHDTLHAADPLSSVASFGYMVDFPYGPAFDKLLHAQASFDDDPALAMLLSAQDSHVQQALVPHQHQSVLHQSINHETRDTQQNVTMPLNDLYTTQPPDLRDSPPEDLVESHDVIVNAPEETQTNEQHNPAVGSSLQNDLSLDVDSMNCLQDCSQPCVVEGVPGLSNASPTNTVQHPDQLHATRDREDGNDTHLFPLPTPIDINPSIALLHSSDFYDNLQVLEAATNATGSSSSKDMNRDYPIMAVSSINATDEQIRNLKRKVEELDIKEAAVKEQMDVESDSSVRKKPRISVEKWLKKTERARNNFQIIGQANVETLPPKEKVVTLMQEVEELIKQALPQTLLIEVRDAKGDAFSERKLIGEAIHGNIELIWDHLKESDVCKLGIYGMGGVGKTTIMMHIHNRLLQDATFDGVVFITVSKDFSIYKLQSDIWSALKLGLMKDEHEKKRAAMLSEHLERKKNCVLILDDVWEYLDLEDVGIPIRGDGFKLVLTTRFFDVCRQMQCQEKIEIKPLSQKEGESLFLEELGSEVTINSEIKTYVESIVRECAGLPIAVMTMARSMRGVTNVFEWRDSLVKLKEPGMGQAAMEKVLMNLKFSYDRLGNPDVQQCFLSCALYPEGKSIDSFELVEFFIDQGLIGGLNTRKEQYDRGLTILNQLGNACLLENQHEIWMKMHDLIRDMALHITSATSIVKAGKQLMNIPPEEDWTDALEKVSLMDNNISKIPLNMSPNCPKLSTLLLNGSLLGDVVIPDSFFKQLCWLKVLNLSRCDLRELPNSISDLVKLRALLLRECSKLRRIPYLGKLTSLRKLDASGCESLEVLEGLEKLVNLRYLGLTETCIERLPKGTLEHLLNLQYCNVSAVIEEDIAKLGPLETFGCYLENADDFNKCVRFIEQGNNPRYDDLKVGLEKPEFIVEVSDDTQFENRGRTVYCWEVSNDIQFGNLGRTVHICGWGHAIVSVEGECIGIFILIPKDVQTMTMRKCNSITNLSSMGPLKYLGGLEIEEWENLRVLCGRHDEEVIDIHDTLAPTPSPLLFSNLRVLRIYYCPKLKYLFGHGFKSNLLHLRVIEISYCEEMVGIIEAVTSPPPHPLAAFPSLEEIDVEFCKKMKRTVESEWMPHFPNLRSIVVRNCEIMEEIIGVAHPCVPVKEISLESLYVYCCDNMRKLFPQEWLLHLQNLQSIHVARCKGMVDMISRAGQGQEGIIMTPVNNSPSSFQPPISLPKLEQLKLFDLPQLKSICEFPISCDSVRELGVYKCPELKGIPLQLRLHKIEDVPYIWMEDEEKWKTLMWDDPNAQAILQPYLRKGEHSIHGFSFWGERPCLPNAIELCIGESVSSDSDLEESPAA